MKFCASSNGGDDLEAAFSSLSIKTVSPQTASPVAQQPSSKPNIPPMRPPEIASLDSNSDLPTIILAMRKLREAILGSRRVDAFAQRAYMFIIHACILTRSWESYQPALQYLLRSIHPVTPLSLPEVQEFSAYLILDLACRQGDFQDAFVARAQWKNRDRKVGAVLRALVQDDWVRFWRAKRAVDGYQRAIMEFAVERVRMHALKCLGRSYMTVERRFVESSGDASWEDLVKGGVGWELGEGDRVVIRRPKAK
jgi:hypothetical protein